VLKINNSHSDVRSAYVKYLRSILASSHLFPSEKVIRSKCNRSFPYIITYIRHISWRRPTCSSSQHRGRSVPVMSTPLLTCELVHTFDLPPGFPSLGLELRIPNRSRGLCPVRDVVVTRTLEGGRIDRRLRKNPTVAERRETLTSCYQRQSLRR
jgi:hypothetical protein